MSSKIKVDTIENVAGSGNVSLGSGHNFVVPGTLNITGASTLTGGIANAGTITAGTLGSSVVFPAGHILQTVRSEYRTYVTTTSTSFVASGVTGTITPKYNNSKILITLLINGLFNTGSAKFISLSLYKASSSIAVLDTSVGYNTASDEINYGIHSNCYQHEDSPSTTSATTYTLYWKTSANSAGINNYNALNGDSLSTITLQEIKQ